MPALSKAQLKQSLAIEESFHRTYAALYGAERWSDSLYPALASSTRYAVLLNKYAVSGIAHVFDGKESNDMEKITLLPGSPSADVDMTPASQIDPSGMLCYRRANTSLSGPNTDRPFPVPRQSQDPNPERRLMTHWNLDAASLLAVSVLGVKPGDKVLDLCAAPGGKSVALAQLLCPSNLSSTKPSLNGGCLHSNEANNARYNRLTVNLQSYIPGSMLKAGEVKVLKIDGTESNAADLLPLGLNGYDKVLVDAPCSSERHIVHAHEKAKRSGHVAEEMISWRAGQSKKMAKVQAELLKTALRAVRPGGMVLYATCSLSEDENDAVVGKAIETAQRQRKKGMANWEAVAGGVQLETEVSNAWAEKTRHGWIVLPDHPGGGKWGPLYFSIVEKKGNV